MPNGLHQVGLAHANAAVQKQRVVSLRWPLRHGLAGRMCELIPAADHERVKRVAWLKLGSAVPVKPRLGARMTADRGIGRRKPAIVPPRGCRSIILGRDE